jgi:hypothetical protein
MQSTANLRLAISNAKKLIWIFKSNTRSAKGKFGTQQKRPRRMYPIILSALLWALLRKKKMSKRGCQVKLSEKSKRKRISGQKNLGKEKNKELLVH